MALPPPIHRKVLACSAGLGPSCPVHPGCGAENSLGNQSSAVGTAVITKQASQLATTPDVEGTAGWPKLPSPKCGPVSGEAKRTPWHTHENSSAVITGSTATVRRGGRNRAMARVELPVTNQGHHGSQLAIAKAVSTMHGDCAGSDCTH